MTIRIPKLKSEHFFGLFLVIFWGQDILFSYVRAVLIRIPYIKYVADYTIPMLMLICLFFAFPYLVKSISRKDIIFAIISIFIFLLHILVYPENESLASISVIFFIKIFPLYFIGLRFDESKYGKLLYVMSIINLCAFTVYYILLGNNTVISDQVEYSGYMNRAYILLPQLLLVIAGILKKPNVFNISIGIWGLILLLMCGNRGSVLLMLFFLVICILFIGERKKRFYVYAGVISVSAVFLYYFEKVLNWLTVLFVRFDMSTRVFERFLEGSYFKSSGRNEIIEKLKVAIWEKPFLGYGLTSDRTISGSYAHNFAYELWTSFGVIVGSILLVTTIYVIIAAWVKSTDKASKMFLLMLICTGFLKLFISSSFLQEGLFFMLLGLCVSMMRQRRRDDL